MPHHSVEMILGFWRLWKDLLSYEGLEYGFADGPNKYPSFVLQPGWTERFFIGLVTGWGTFWLHLLNRGAKLQREYHHQNHSSLKYCWSVLVAGHSFFVLSPFLVGVFGEFEIGKEGWGILKICFHLLDFYSAWFYLPNLHCSFSFSW